MRIRAINTGSRMADYLLILAMSIPFMGEIYAQKAVSFESPGDFIEVSHSPSLAPSEFTIELWIKLEEVGNPDNAGGEQTILDKRDGDAGFNLRLAGTAFPLPVFAFVLPGDVSMSDVIQWNLWQHIAVTQDTDSLKIYLNGEMLGASVNSYISDTKSDLRIGEFRGYPGAYLGLHGDIDELRIWDYARSRSEIRSGMHEILTGTENGLSACWGFENVIGNSVKDLSPNGNDGILNGNAMIVESEAPVGFIPPDPPVGLRAIGEDQSIRLAWRPGIAAITSYLVYRGDSLKFPVDTTHLIATVYSPDSIYMDIDIVPGEHYYYAVRAAEGEHFSQRSSRCISRIKPVTEGYETGVYYYPWYGPGLHEWEGSYVRDFLVPRQPPFLGHYSSRDPAKIRQHLDWMQSSGIDFMVCSWWGQNSREDITIRDYMLGEIEKTPVKFSLYYESAILGFSDQGIFIDEVGVEQLVDDFNYMADTYFDHPNLLRIDDRPVVFLYLSSIFSGDYEWAFSLIRDELYAKGFDLFLIGDEVGWSATSASHMQFLDAVSPYLLLPDQQRHGNYPLDGSFFADASVKVREWEDVAGAQGIVVIPNVNPGFNNRAGGSSGFVRPRQLQPGAGSSSMLEEYIRVMRPFVDPQYKMIMVTSWNEWHEDSQVEPTIVTGPTSVDVSASQDFYTQNFSYEGYGLACLEVIRSLLASELPPVGSIEKPGNPVSAFALYQNYPNPVRSSTTISYTIQIPGYVKLKVYDVLGKEVQTLVDEFQEPATYHFQLDMDDLPGGTYFYQLYLEDFSSQTMKMNLLQ